MDKLVDATVDYSGAELEQAVIAALYDAFDTGNDLTTEGLLKTLNEIVPLAITMREHDRVDARVGADPRAHGLGARPRACQEGGLDGALRRADGEPRRQGPGDQRRRRTEARAVT